MSQLTPGRRSAWPNIAAGLTGAACLAAAFILPFDNSPDNPGAKPNGSNPNCIPLVVSSSTEKDGLLIELAGRYNTAGRTFGNGRCAAVEVHGTTSGDAMEALAAEGGWDPNSPKTKAPVPHVWMPTSSLWLGLLDLKAKRKLWRDAPPSVAASALVVAMPWDMGQALRADRERRNQNPAELGWSDILGVTIDPVGWGGKGHPNWGEFVLGRDNPTSSTSGLTATIATYHAADLHATKVKGITAADLENPDVISFVHGVESSVPEGHFGDDSTEFMRRLYDEDRKKKPEDKPFISAIAVQEQMVYLYNHGAPTGDMADFNRPEKPRRLMAVHPADGTVKLDHPYVVLSTANAEQQAAADNFGAFLLEQEQQRRFIQLGFRDRNRPEEPTQELKELTASPEKRLSFIDMPKSDLVAKMVEGWKAAHRKARVLLVLDVSGSMNELADENAKEGETAGKSKLDLLKPAAKRGVELLSAGDEVELWTFSASYEVKVPRKSIRDARAELNAAIDALVPATSTSLYTTILEARNKLAKDYKQDRINAVVLMTDGINEDRNGTVTFDDVLNAVSGEPRVRIYTIPYGKAAATTDVLGPIADKSGGGNYAANDPAKVGKAFVDVFRNL